MKHKQIIILLILYIFCVNLVVSQTKVLPSIKEVISLYNVNNASISPNGENIVFIKQSTNWKENKSDYGLWISRKGTTPKEITKNEKESIISPKWSPDGKWIAYISNTEEGNQIFVVDLNEEKRIQLTHTSSNIYSFQWSPNSKQIAFIKPEDKSKQLKKRKEKYGDFTIVDNEYQLNEVWVINFSPNNLSQSKSQLLIHNNTFSINNFKWSPKGDKIAFEHQPKPGLEYLFLNDISVYDINTHKIKPLVQHKSYDGLIGWSPNGKSILYQTCLDNNSTNFTLNRKLFRINIDTTNNYELAKDFDEDLEQIIWNEEGIFGLAWQKTNRQIIKIDPKLGNFNILPIATKRIWDYSFSKNNKKLTYTGVNNHDLNDIYITYYPVNKTLRVTNSSNQIKNWVLDKREVIQWKNKDNITIEGVIHKPRNFNSEKKYPLFIIIHGGPMFLSYPELTPQYAYPMLQWVNKGALVLRVNYTGSTGYGEKFRTNNIKKLGIVDAEDILSGIHFLEKKGFIDSDKIGCMGWSHGGFLSATLLTNSNKFKAFSVGAGVINWTSNYINTDLKQFSNQYLGGTPWDFKEFYDVSSPISKIRNAKAPTLIQHCKFDNRVNILNSYELYEALKSINVKTKFITYNVYGHGIYSPKEKLAANLHNWNWFLKYIWNEEVKMP